MKDYLWATLHRNEALRWIDQLRNHPSIIQWVVFNEGWGQHDTVDLTNMVMKVNKLLKINILIDFLSSGWPKQTGELRQWLDWSPCGPRCGCARVSRARGQRVPRQVQGEWYNHKEELLLFLFQIYARDSKRAAVVGEMWGVSRHIRGHNWSHRYFTNKYFSFVSNLS